MKLPPNFARKLVPGQRLKTWAIRIGDRAFALTFDRHARKPGGVRRRIEQALGIKTKAEKSAEEIVTMKARHQARMARAFRNKVAKNGSITPPWAQRGRSLRSVVAEERVLNIANRWQRMGEFRR